MKTRRFEFAFLGYLLAPGAFGGAMTDGTMGPVASLSGKFEVGQNLGTRLGDNLFHSFAQFSLERGESARFTGDADIRNVIARVTGGEASRIDGLLRSSVGRADFYFINPDGTVFGEHAQVDVPAAFRVSTADELRFADGARFGASHPEGSSLSALAPEAYGFLGDHTASIRLEGAYLDMPGADMSLTAQNLSMSGSVLAATDGHASLIAVGDKPINVSLAGLPEKVSGRIAMEGADGQNSAIILSGERGAELDIRAGSLSLKDTRISADNTGSLSSDSAWHIDIRAQTVALDENSRVSSGAFGAGSGGAVRVEVERSLSLNRGSQIISNASGVGAAGEVDVRAGRISIAGWDDIDRPTGIGSEALENSQGDAGTVKLDAGHLELRDAGVVSVKSKSSGDAGSIEIKAGTLDIDGSRFKDIGDTEETKLLTGIVANAAKTSTGDSGHIDVAVRGDLRIAVGEISSSVYGPGRGGDVKVRADRIELDGRGAIKNHFTGIDAASVDFGQGAGIPGKVDIRAREAIVIRGARVSILNAGFSSAPASFSPNALSLSAPSIVIESGVVTAQSTGNLPGSPLHIAADFLRVEGGYIGTEARDGDGGPVRVQAGTIMLDHARLTTSVTGPDNGNGGDILVRGQNLVMDGGFIQANTMAQAARGGRILVDVEHVIPNQNLLRVGGDAVVAFSPASRLNLIQAAAPDGISGAIVLTAPQLNLSGVLANLGGPQFDAGAIGQDYCALGSGSSLTRIGRGGLPARYVELPLRSVSGQIVDMDEAVIGHDETGFGRAAEDAVGGDIHHRARFVEQIPLE
jgi:filamentous hemagglutinin family protein